MYSDQMKAHFGYSASLPGVHTPQTTGVTQDSNNFTTTTETTIVILNADGTLSNEFRVGEGVSMDDIRKGLYTENTSRLPASSSPSSPYNASPPRVGPRSPLDLTSLPPLPPMSSLMPPQMISPTMAPMISPQSQVYQTSPPPGYNNISPTTALNRLRSPLSPPSVQNVLSESNGARYTQQMPRNLIDNALSDLKTFNSSPPSVKPETVGGGYETYLHQNRENFYLLDELNKMASYPNQQQLSPEHPPTLGPSLRDRNEDVNRVPRNGMKRNLESAQNHETVVPYKRPRTATSIGAIGQALYGLAGKQICPLCRFEATTKNPYRHLQDHLGRPYIHFVFMIK